MNSAPRPPNSPANSMTTGSRTLAATKLQRLQQEMGRRRLQVPADLRPVPSLMDFIRRTFPNYDPAPHHALLIDHLERINRGELKRLLVMMPPRHGKALALDTPIPTPTGWRRMDQLAAGDYVFDERGVPCRVTWVSPVWKDRPVYRVTTDDGDTIVADAEHLWLAQLDRGSRFHLHRTEVIARKRAKRARITIGGPLELPEEDLIVDPYVLGLWLGDGSAQSATITAGDVDRPFLRAEVERLGYRTSDRKTEQTFGILGIDGKLRLAGVLNNKHIPPWFLRTSYEQRVSLLQGLVDSDGHVEADGQVEFCSTNLSLAEGVRELVHSLGRKASLVHGRATLHGRDCGPKYRVMFYFCDAARLPRKRERCRDGVKHPDHYVSAEAAGVRDTICISVDSPSHMFLCGRSMLPTHNSEAISVNFPAWYLAQHPEDSIIACAYGWELIRDFSKRAQDLIRHPMFPTMFPGIGLDPKSASVQRWRIAGHRGYYLAAGIGGPVTGFGANGLIIDDPVRSRQDVESRAQRDKIWTWYKSGARTRLHAGGFVILTLTRWHMDDLAGRLLAEMEAGGEQWVVIRLPAKAEDGDVLGRAVGEALWPAHIPQDEVDMLERTMPPYEWSSLYQQHPTPPGGSIFLREYWRDFDPGVPRELSKVITIWDTAFKSEDQHDYNGVWTAGLGLDGNIYVLDVQKIKATSAEMIGTDHSPGIIARYYHWLADAGLAPAEVGIEDKGSGTTAIQLLAANAPYLPIVPIRVGSAGKEERARAVIPFYIAGRILHRRNAPWREWFEQMCEAFPGGEHDDPVDAMTHGIVRLVMPPERYVEVFHGPRVSLGSY